MALSEGTRETVRDLRSIGGQHGRSVTALVEDDDLGSLEERHDRAVVELPGVPSITIRVDGDLEDTVTLDEVMHFEVPRRDTVAFVEAVLDGKARLRRDAENRWNMWLLLIPFLRFMVPWTNTLVVPVPGRTPYERSVPFAPTRGGWLSSVPSLT